MDTLFRLNSAEFSPFIPFFFLSLFPPTGASGHISLDLSQGVDPRKFFLEPPDICAFSELRRSEVSFDIQSLSSEAFLFQHVWVTFFAVAVPWHVPFFKVRVILPGSMQIKLVTLCRDKCFHYPTPSTYWFAFETRTQAIFLPLRQILCNNAESSEQATWKICDLPLESIFPFQVGGLFQIMQPCKILGQGLSGWGDAAGPGSIPGVRQMMVPSISNIREPA